MVINGNICTLYLRLNNQTFYLIRFLWMKWLLDSTVSALAVDGGLVNIIKIKTLGTGGTNGTHTGVDN